MLQMKKLNRKTKQTKKSEQKQNKKIPTYRYTVEHDLTTTCHIKIRGLFKSSFVLTLSLRSSMLQPVFLKSKYVAV